MLNIVLHEPEMPANTGNIGRTCVATGAVLHLIEPMGFIINDKMLKRAGLDYWKILDVRTYINYADFLEKNPEIVFGNAVGAGPRLFMATTKAPRNYCDISYKDGDYIMFGKESAGIPESILKENEETCIRIPMRESIRSLNLSNSVSIVLYEALRQIGFEGLQEKGEPRTFKWQ